MQTKSKTKNNTISDPIPSAEYVTPIADALDAQQIPTRDGYGQALLELGETNPDVVVLTGDLADSTRTLDFKNKYPERFFEMGVAEQNMMGVAAGLALAGKIPFVSSYATFSPGRSWDQLRVSVAYSKANVKIIGAHTGVSVGPDGATHQALEDVAIVRCLPNTTVILPADANQAKQATLAAAAVDGPVYIRLTRENTPVFIPAGAEFSIGKAQILKDGTDVAIIASGPVVYNALLAADILEKEGINAMVINNHTIKPLDSDTIIAVAKRCGAVVTLEEHQIMGGCGSAVCELLAQNYPVPVEMLGMHDSFGESGEPEQLIKKYGMDKDAVVEAVKRILKKK